MSTLSLKQREMLIAFHDDGEATDLHEFGSSALGWGNRERVISALQRRGLVDGDGITDSGRALVSKLLNKNTKEAAR